MASTETFHCTTCPSECLLTVCVERDGDGTSHAASVHGNRCPRGKRFAEQEIICPMRILATTVVVEGGDERLVPVRTRTPIPRGLHERAMETVRELRVSAPVHMGDVIAADLLDSGVDLIASMDVDLA